MHEFRFKNNCQFTIWPGIYGQSTTPLNGGFELNPGKSESMAIARGWHGKIWARQGCDANGQCITGDCGRGIQCRGADTQAPVTVASFALDDWGGIDYYEITLINGFNLPMQITPIEGTFQKISFAYYNCAKLDCLNDVITSCPDGLAVRVNDTKVACKSSCAAYSDDKHCCRGSFGTASTCIPTDWTINSAELFKTACPSAITYNYDNITTFMCVGNPITGYEIAFCN